MIMSGIFCQKANANDIRLCHELINLPIKTPIIERYKDSLGIIEKKVPPNWGEAWYTFRFSTNERYVEISGAIILNSKPSDMELLYNGEFYIETAAFECGCEVENGKRKCHDWKEKKIWNSND